MRSSTVGWATASILFLATAASSFAQAPVTVSPGSASGRALTEARCPTFSWGAVSGAENYELVVYRLPEESEEAKPVLRQTFAGSVDSWTPSLAACLERGAQYAWSVRVLGGDTPGDWSAPSLFEVSLGPSETEFEQALSVVQRYLAAQDHDPTQSSVKAETERTLRQGRSAGTPEPLSPPPGTQLSVDGVVDATSFSGSGALLTAVDAETLSGVSIADLATEAELASEIGGHAGDPDVHREHATLEESVEIDTDVATHAALPNVHHVPTVDTDTVLTETQVKTFVAGSTLDGSNFTDVTAVAGDSATGFFPTGEIEEARVADTIARDAEVSALLGGLSLCPAAAGFTDRFTDCGNGTVRDNNTALIWLKDANCFGMRDWPTAIADADALSSGACGLTDGSVAGQWHLARIQEFCSQGEVAAVCPTADADDSLVNTNFSNPTLSNAAGDVQWTEGDPFVGVQWSTGSYFSANEFDATNAWRVSLDGGSVSVGPKGDALSFVWPVRGPADAELGTHAGDADAHREHATLEESAEIDDDIAAHAALPGAHHIPTLDTDTDTLAGLGCADGQLAKWNDSLAQWECAQDETTSTADLEEELCRLYLQTGELPVPIFCDLDPVNGSVDITGQPVGQVAVNPVTDRVYIGASYSLSLQPLKVIDVSDKTNPSVVTTVTGSGATTNPSTDRFYAKGGTGLSGTILVYNGADNGLITSVPVGFCGGQFDTDTSTNLIYMTSQCGGGNDPLHVLNGATDTLAAGPLGSGGVVGHVRVNAATGNAYVSRTGGTRVFGPSPGFAVVTDLTGISIQTVNPVTNRLYFSTGSALEVRSGVDHSLITTIPGVTGAFGVNTASNRVYSVDGPGQLIKVIDGATNTVIGDISLGTGVTPGGGAVDSSKNRLYITGTATGSTRLYVVTDTVP